jgi:hypothetical protein
MDLPDLGEQVKTKPLTHHVSVELEVVRHEYVGL